MAELGRQTPTQSVIIPYSKTGGKEAVELYNSTSRKALDWQELLIYDILAVNEDGLYTHSKFGYAVPRRNGKNEIVAMREMYGLKIGEHILHTAHRTTTSRAAWERLKKLLEEAGITYKATAAIGMESIRMTEGEGRIDFRTRSSKGGLGEGFDLLIIDEAQEYQDDQETALKYVVSDSQNPQTIFCGTPPTASSSGTVFMKLRDAALSGTAVDTGWVEWSVEHQTDPHDKTAWYKTNPSLGVILTERKILAEIGPDELDFNIQRLGFWIRYNLQSAISEVEWKELMEKKLPKLEGRLHVGIKYGHDGTNVAMSIAVKATGKKIFVETIDCRPIRAGNSWILDFLSQADIEKVVIDGANGQEILAKEMKEEKMKAPILPTVKEVIVANTAFEQRLFAKTLCHMNQPSLTRAVSNCEKRAIGSNGGFGYRSIKDTVEIALLDSIILASWSCGESKEKKKQKISY